MKRVNDPEIRVTGTEILSDNWYTLKKVSYVYRRGERDWETQVREAYDRGNGATILLFNAAKRKVILTRQFRLPTYINGNTTGMLIEACAGLLDEKDPEDCIRRETEEETGYVIQQPRKIYDAYMSPGSVTEVLHFYVAEYDESMKQGEGGGLKAEQEHIEVLEIPFEEAIEMLRRGEIRDAKTIMLLQYALIHDLIPSDKISPGKS